MGSATNLDLNRDLRWAFLLTASFPFPLRVDVRAVLGQRRRAPEPDRAGGVGNQRRLALQH